MSLFWRAPLHGVVSCSYNLLRRQTLNVLTKQIHKLCVMVAMLISLIIVIISQRIPGSKYELYFKCIQFPSVYYNLIKLKKFKIKVTVWQLYLMGLQWKLTMCLLATSLDPCDSLQIMISLIIQTYWTRDSRKNKNQYAAIILL